MPAQNSRNEWRSVVTMEQRQLTTRRFHAHQQDTLVLRLNFKVLACMPKYNQQNSSGYPGQRRETDGVVANTVNPVPMLHHKLH
jgi:hypothetical protein